MADYTLGYREVIPDHILSDKWKDITLNIGGSQSTLQDIKVPERAGGYYYKDSTQYVTRNRFIYWKIVHDVLELVEYSLDVHLTNNQVRYKFTDTPILDGISIHETIDSVVILVATVSSIHKLSFSHPNLLQKQEQRSKHSISSSIRSIFCEATIQSATDPRTFYVIPTIGSTNFQVAHAAASSFILNVGDALFTLAYNTGTLFLLRLNSVSGSVHTTELKQDSIVPRFLSGIATAFRGRGNGADVAVSLITHACNNEIYIFALCKEGHLRMWSRNKTLAFAMTDVIFNDCNDTIQNHLLRKAITPDNNLYLCSYFKFELNCVFTIYKVTPNNRIIKLVQISSSLAFDQHLVDFAFSTTCLWAVWRTSDIDTTSVKYIKLPLKAQQLNHEWESVVLVQTSTKEYTLNDFDIDPRQAYTDHIFRPGQFSMMDIIRALNIFRKSSFFFETNSSTMVLKNKVCAAVESEIQAEVVDYELMDEDYLEIVNRCWSRFYSCVLQYHINRLWPVGLLLLPHDSGIILIKKSFISVIRPIEILEDLILRNETSFSGKLRHLPIFSHKEILSKDVIALMSAVNMIEEQLPDNFVGTFEKELFYLKSPDSIIKNMFFTSSSKNEQILSDFDFKTNLCTKLENIKDICRTLSFILEVLTCDLDFQQSCKLNSAEFLKSDSIHADNPFGSQLGTSIISETVTQIVLLRFNTCRNLLILQQIACQCTEIFDSQSLQTIKSSLAPRTVVLIQAYYVVKWICKINATTSISPKHSKLGLQRLHSLKLADETYNQQQENSFSILSSFINYCMKQNMHGQANELKLNAVPSIHSYSNLLSYSSLFIQFIWPISDSFLFPAWLLSKCEFFLVQEYVRLLSIWCEWNYASREFILAVSLLETGEPQKACDHFIKASNGVIPDTYLFNVILEPNTPENMIIVQYFLKIIEIFENYNSSDFVIELAILALTVADNNYDHLPTLYSIIFVEHLNLQHYVEAYNFLNANPDIARRVDCLRQLIVALFHHKNLVQLVSFPYINMYEHLEEIVEARARSGDLTENNYYDFLYCFHINKGNFRKAASIMYEQAIRYTQESCSLFNIAQQIQCLCVSLNTINLVNEKYRWIIRPTNDKHAEECNTAFAIDRIHKNQILQYKVNSYMEIFKSEDVKKQYLLAEAKHKIFKNDFTDYSSSQISSSEIVAIMSNLGYYTDALKICDYFNLNKTIVLENITSQCVKYSQNKIPFKGSWFFENNISDLKITMKNKADIFWKLLEELLLKHESKQKTDLHKSVASKIFYFGALLPNWLISSYKKQNVAELIRLTMQMGRLEEAANLCIEYIKAMTGKGQEFFGLNSSLLAVAPSVFLPINIIEILLLELEFASFNDQNYVEVYKSLLKTFETYVKMVNRVSSSMIYLKSF